MDKTMRIWNIIGENTHTLTEFTGSVNSLTSLIQGKEKFIIVGSSENKVKVFDQTDYKLQSKIGDFDTNTVVSIVTDIEGEFLFIGEKNGIVKIYYLGSDQDKYEEGGDLKQMMNIGTNLNCLNFESIFYCFILLATEKGLLIRDIRIDTNFLKYPVDKDIPCLSLAWDVNSKIL